MTFLEKIFESVQINLEGDAISIVSTQNNHFSWNSITNSFDFDRLVFFGTTPKKIGLFFDYNWYDVFSVQERRFLMAEPLQLIAED